MCVVRLITQRSQVQILPPLPAQRPLPIKEGAFCVLFVHGFVHGPLVKSGAATRRRFRRSPRRALALVRPRPARPRRPYRQHHLISTKPIRCAVCEAEAAVFLGVQCPGHGRRVQGAFGVACDRFATMDPATAPQD